VNCEGTPQENKERGGNSEEMVLPGC